MAESLSLPDVWEQVAQGLDRDTVVGALASISPPQREAIELAYFEGLTQVRDRRPHRRAAGHGQGVRLRLGLRGLRRALTGEEAADG